MGLDVYLVRGQPTDDYDRERYVEIASEKHPEHYWKIGYHRSSYNDGGFNNVVSIYGLPDLHDVYGVDEDTEPFTPDWAAVKERAVAAIAQLDGARSEYGGLSFFAVDSVVSADQTSEADFLRHAAKNLTRDTGALDRGWWASREGTFTAHEASAMRVVGVRVTVGPFGPVAWLACLQDTEGDDTFDYLRACYEIIVETCDYALAATEPLYVSWSG